MKTILTLIAAVAFAISASAHCGKCEGDHKDKADKKCSEACKDGCKGKEGKCGEGCKDKCDKKGEEKK